MRILLLRLFHETNSFAPGLTGTEHFDMKRGSEVLETPPPQSIIHAIANKALETNIELVPCFDFGAAPGPIASDHIVEEALNCLDTTMPKAIEKGIDGIFAILHGAMVSKSHEDVEGFLLERIQQIIGTRRIPVAAVLDLHANISQKMARGANILVAYQKNPHIDAVESALRCFALLIEDITSNTHSKNYLFQFPLFLPPILTGTSEEPMSGLLEIARRREISNIKSISVCPGFAYSDTQSTGLSFISVSKDNANEEVKSAFQELEIYIRLHMPKQLSIDEWSLDDAITDALGQKRFPTLIVEPGDNIGGGCGGRATWVLHSFIKHRISNAAVSLTAPEAVETLSATAEGSDFELSLGDMEHPESGPILHLQGKLLRHFEGFYEVEDKQSHFVGSRGTRINMGSSVLLQAFGIFILLTSRPTPPMDLGQWRCVGVNPEKLTFIGIKAAIAHRQAYDPIAGSSYTVGTPGPCASNLNLLNYKKIRRPIWPLDPMPDSTSTMI